MKSKKGNELANALIDDLIDEEETLLAGAQKNKKLVKPSAKETEEPTAVSPKSKTGLSDFSISVLSDGEEDEDPDATLQAPAKVPKPKQDLDSTVPIEPVTYPTKGAAKKRPSEPTLSTRAEKTESVESSFMPLTSSQIKAHSDRVVGIGGVSSPTQSTLVQSENLRVAQEKILELEEEISRLRTENEELAAAGETLRVMSDEAIAHAEAEEKKYGHLKEVTRQEIELLNESLAEKDKKIQTLKKNIDEMEMRLSTNIQKIRVRERELENRLEIVRFEGQAVARSKDEMVLDLKRQIDQLNNELENYRSKGQDLNKQLTDKQEMLNRTVKALRLALTMLEGDESVEPIRRVK